MDIKIVEKLGEFLEKGLTSSDALVATGEALGVSTSNGIFDMLAFYAGASYGNNEGDAARALMRLDAATLLKATREAEKGLADEDFELGREE